MTQRYLAEAEQGAITTQRGNQKYLFTMKGTGDGCVQCALQQFSGIGSQWLNMGQLDVVLPIQALEEMLESANEYGTPFNRQRGPRTTTFTVLPVSSMTYMFTLSLRDNGQVIAIMQCEVSRKAIVEKLKEARATTAVEEAKPTNVLPFRKLPLASSYS